MTNESVIQQLQSGNLEAQRSAVKYFSSRPELSERELEALLALGSEARFIENQHFALIISNHPQTKCLPIFLHILESGAALSQTVALESLPNWIEKLGGHNAGLAKELSNRLIRLESHELHWIRFLACMGLAAIQGDVLSQSKSLAQIVKVAEEETSLGIRSQVEEILLEPELIALNNSLKELGLDPI